MLPLTLLWAVMVGELDLSLGLEAEPLTDLFALDVTSKYVLLGKYGYGTIRYRVSC